MQAHGNGHLVVLLIPCAGHATEHANKSGGTLATSHSIHASAKKKQIVVKDKHLCCRDVLSTSYSFVRSDSNGKQRRPSWSKLRSRSIRRRLHRQLEIAQDVALTWLTPLELAACFHLASACTHQTVHTDRCEPNHCWVRPSTRPSAQEMSAVAIALTILLLAIMDWHVPRVTTWQPITCRVLTAMCMYALRADTACTVTALLLPTFGKRSQAQASTARKRSTTASHATEQTEAAAISPTTQQGDDQGNLETEHNIGSTQEQTSTPSINSMEN